METLYDWLLHNTGNAGNYYTILNVQHDEAGYLDVMARTADFKVVNLFIYEAQLAEASESRLNNLSSEAPKNKYGFSDEQQVISYLAQGKTPEPQQPDTTTGLRVLVAEPTAEAGSVTFPPAQT